MCGSSKCCMECQNKKVQGYSSETLARIVEPGDFEESYPLQQPAHYLETDPPKRPFEYETFNPEKSFSESQYPEAFEAENDGMASWISMEDRIPLKLAISIYTIPIRNFGGFQLFAVQSRSGAWYNCSTKTVVIGLRGTALTNNGGAKDLLDDTQIALGDLCSLSLVQEASTLVDELASQEIVEEIIFAGHSLGGTAAFCLAKKYTNTRAISLNMGAPATNPVTTGPGPEKAIHYHIVGDAVSSHVSPDAAKIVRIAIRDTNFLSTYWTHQATRALASDVPWTYADADYEDQLWQNFTGDFEAFKTVFPEFGVAVDFLSVLRGRRFPEQIPIPGSSRALMPGAVSTEASWENVLYDIGEIGFQLFGGSVTRKAKTLMEGYHDAKLLRRAKPFTKGFGRRLDESLIHARDELHSVVRGARKVYKKGDKLRKKLGFDRETQALRQRSRRAQRNATTWAEDLLDEHTRMINNPGADLRIPQNLQNSSSKPLNQMFEVPNQRPNKLWHKRIGKTKLKKR